MFPRICAPWTGCFCISANSSGVSLPGLLRIESGTAILPTSCSSADSSAVWRSDSLRPISSASCAVKRRDALRMAVRVAVARVDRGGDRLDRVEQQPLELPHQPHAVHRDAGLVADRRQQLEVGLVEPAGAAQAVDVQRAEDLVGGPQRHAHHRPDALADDALPFAEPRVAARVVREDRHALARSRSATSVRLTANRSVDCVFDRAASTSISPVFESRAPQDDRAAVGRRARRGWRAASRPTAARRSRAGRQRLAHAVQRREMPLRALEQRELRGLALPTPTASRNSTARCAAGSPTRPWTRRRTRSGPGAASGPTGSRTSRIAAPSRIRSPARAVDSLTGRSLMNVPFAESRSLTCSTAVGEARSRNAGATPTDRRAAGRTAPCGPTVMLWPGASEHDAIGVANGEFESGRHERSGHYRTRIIRMPHLCRSARARARCHCPPSLALVLLASFRRPPSTCRSAPRPSGSRRTATPPAA